jgi:hypothetical protein
VESCGNGTTYLNSARRLFIAAICWTALGTLTIDHYRHSAAAKLFSFAAPWFVHV